MKIVKLSDEQLALVGAATAEEFPAKLAAFHAAAKQLETAMAESPSLSDLQARLGKLEAITPITEARVSELITGSVPNAVTAFAASDAGKKVIGAEASRVAMEALAGVGTMPAKAAPVSADETPAQKVQALEAQGKFEEAWAANPNLQAEFPEAKGYAAFRRAQNKGQVRIVTKPN